MQHVDDKSTQRGLLHQKLRNVDEQVNLVEISEACIIVTTEGYVSSSQGN